MVSIKAAVCLAAVVLSAQPADAFGGFFKNLFNWGGRNNNHGGGGWGHNPQPMPNNDGWGLESHSMDNSSVVSIQKRYIEKVVDTLNEFDNVIYEISNEDGDMSRSFTWQNNMMSHLKTYQSSKPKSGTGSEVCEELKPHPQPFPKIGKGA